MRSYALCCLFGLMLFPLSAAADCPAIDLPGGGPCTEGDAGSFAPYVAETAVTSVVAGVALMVEIVATADDTLTFRPAVHVALAVVGAGNVALGTASAIHNRDGGASRYLPGPIIAGVTGLPLIVMSIYNLAADSPPQEPSAGAMVSCTGGRCRPGVPAPLMMSDSRGTLAPGFQILGGRF